MAVALLAGVFATTPCENLTTLKLDRATIASAVVVPEGPPPAPPARGGGAPRGAGGVAAPAGAARGGQSQRGGDGNARGAVQPRPNIPEHCRVELVLKPSTDSLINM